LRVIEQFNVAETDIVFTIERDEITHQFQDH